MAKVKVNQLKNTPHFIPEFFSRIEETGGTPNHCVIEAEYCPSLVTHISVEKERGTKHTLSLAYPFQDKDIDGWSEVEDFYSLPIKAQNKWLEEIVLGGYFVYSLGCSSCGKWILERWDSDTDSLSQIETENPSDDIIADWWDLDVYLKLVESRTKFDVLWQGLYYPRLDQVKTVVRTYLIARSHVV